MTEIIQSALFIAAALLPIYGIFAIRRARGRTAASLTRLALMIQSNEPEGTVFPQSIAEDIKRQKLEMNFPYAQDIAAAAKDAKTATKDLVVIGSGLACGAVASIWSLYS